MSDYGNKLELTLPAKAAVYRAPFAIARITKDGFQREMVDCCPW